MRAADKSPKKGLHLRGDPSMEKRAFEDTPLFFPRQAAGCGWIPGTAPGPDRGLLGGQGDSMTLVETALLGIVQGLTEFLPVSSSGHLVVFQHLLGFKEPELLLDASLHLGTLGAVILTLRGDLKSMLSELWPPRPSALKGSLLVAVVLGSIPTAIMGLLFKEPFEAMFASTRTVGAMLLLTGGVVSLSRWAPGRLGPKTRVGALAALGIGVAQGLAIIPGLSRSGLTIVCGLLFGLQRDLAGRFSFLLAIPAITGALLLQMNPQAWARVGPAPLLTGFAVAFVVGFLALKWLLRIVRAGHLAYFAPYCWIAGILALCL